VIPHADLHGLYHVGGPTINKFDLLCEIAKIYGKKIDILPENEFVMNRSFDSEKFYKATGYASAAWPDLIQMMHAVHNA
jgi:dTDP-4-dehydrorhamnose reductase